MHIRTHADSFAYTGCYGSRPEMRARGVASRMKRVELYACLATGIILAGCSPWHHLSPDVRLGLDIQCPLERYQDAAQFVNQCKINELEKFATSSACSQAQREAIVNTLVDYATEYRTLLPTASDGVYFRCDALAALAKIGGYSDTDPATKERIAKLLPSGADIQEDSTVGARRCGDSSLAVMSQNHPEMFSRELLLRIASALTWRAKAWLSNVLRNPKVSAEVKIALIESWELNCGDRKTCSEFAVLEAVLTDTSVPLPVRERVLAVYVRHPSRENVLGRHDGSLLTVAAQVTEPSLQTQLAIILEPFAEEDNSVASGGRGVARVLYHLARNGPFGTQRRIELLEKVPDVIMQKSDAANSREHKGGVRVYPSAVEELTSIALAVDTTPSQALGIVDLAERLAVHDAYCGQSASSARDC